MNTFQKALTIGVLAATSSIAFAAPIFSFTEYGGFTDDVGIAVYTGQVVAPGLVHEGEAVYSTMEWNESFTIKSKLNLTTFQGALAADTWTTISTLTHTNNLISGSENWSGQDIWGRLRINDADGGADNVLDSDEAITIGLTETTNAGTCPAPNPVGTTCDDFFSFTAAGLAPLLFNANDGSLWKAEFRFFNLENAEQIGNTIYTGEKGVSSLDVQVQITQVSSVPEPATLGIFGLGLLGLGLAKRRKLNG